MVFAIVHRIRFLDGFPLGKLLQQIRVGLGEPQVSGPGEARVGLG